jgi:hypothetical protein
MGLLTGTLYPTDPRRAAVVPPVSFWALPPILTPLLGGGALHGTAVRLALIMMAAAGLAGILLVIACKGPRLV